MDTVVGHAGGGNQGGDLARSLEHPTILRDAMG